MKQITSRGQLVELINKGIETYTFFQNDKKKILHTIIFNPKNRMYYRIEWGLVKDSSNVGHLWFNQNLVKVNFDKRSTKWMTSKESNDYLMETEDNVSWLYKDGLLFINGETRNFKEEKEKEKQNKVSIVGGKKGSGKSEYAYTKTAKSIESGKTVLFFSAEYNKEEVLRRILRAMTLDVYKKIEQQEELTQEEKLIIEEAKERLSNAKLEIHHDCTVEVNSVLKKMYEKKEKEELDLVVLDGLRFANEAPEDILRVHNRMDKHRQFLDCNVIITTNLKPSDYKEFTS